MDYTNLTLKKYLKALAGKYAVPGGGSSVSVVGANATALLLMVCNFTIGVKAYTKYEKRIFTIIHKLEKVLKTYEKLVTEDTIVYTALVQAFKLPKEDKKRASKLKKALKDAAKVPQEICDLSLKTIVYADELIEKGNKNLITDIACSILFFKAAFDASKYNVLINIEFLDKDLYKKEKLKFKEQSKIMDKKSKFFLKKIDKIMG